MKIDRSKFFALTTAISASVIAALGTTAGCSSTAGSDAGTDGATAADTGGGITGDGSVDAGACLGTIGHASCQTDAGNVDQGCATLCSTAIDNFTAGTAESIANCLLQLPTCEGNSSAVSTCYDDAIGHACADTSVTAYCADIVTKCGDAGVAELKPKCEFIAPALSATGRTQFTNCVTESACSVPVDQCLAGLEGAF